MNDIQIVIRLIIMVLGIITAAMVLPYIIISKIFPAPKKIEKEYDIFSFQMNLTGSGRGNFLIEFLDEDRLLRSTTCYTSQIFIGNKNSFTQALSYYKDGTFTRGPVISVTLTKEDYEKADANSIWSL